MQLNEWIKEKGFTRAYIAKKLDLNELRLHRILHGMEPSLEEMLAIENVTHRRVKMEDFINRAKEQSQCKLQKKTLPKQKQHQPKKATIPKGHA